MKEINFGLLNLTNKQEKVFTFFVFILFSFFFYVDFLTPLILILAFFFLIIISESVIKQIQYDENGVLIDGTYYPYSSVLCFKVGDFEGKPSVEGWVLIHLLVKNEKDEFLYLRLRPNFRKHKIKKLAQELFDFILELEKTYPDLNHFDEKILNEKMSNNKFVVYSILSIFYILVFILTVKDLLEWSPREIYEHYGKYTLLVFWGAILISFFQWKIFIKLTKPLYNLSSETLKVIRSNKKGIALILGMLIFFGGLRLIHYVERNFTEVKNEVVLARLVDKNKIFAKGCFVSLTYRASGYDDFKVSVGCDKAHLYPIGKSRRFLLSTGELGGVWFTKFP